MWIEAARRGLAMVFGIALVSGALVACGSKQAQPQNTADASAISGASGGAGPAATASGGSSASAGSPAARGSGGTNASGSGGVGGTGTSGSSAGMAGGGGGAGATTAASGGRASAAGAGGASGKGGDHAGASGGAGNQGAAGNAGSAASGRNSGDATVGSGDIAHPASGPAPSDAAKVGGDAFVLVKNWDFGTNGTIRNTDDLVAEFVFHDQFNTIANGTHYGAVIVAPTADTAISAGNLGLANDKQPVEDLQHPNREYTADTLKAHVRPLSASQTTASAAAHNAGNGSFVAKWKLPKGGALLGQDLLWETRVRFPTPGKAYWFALWCAGNQWNGGAEMDVLESFGAPNTYPPANSFHVDPVGGSGSVNYSSWPNALDSVGVTVDKRDLTQWHVFSWYYAKDDSYKVYFDGKQVQSGSIHWTNGGGTGGAAIDLDFLFDFGWGWVASGSENQIEGLDAELPASDFPITYEIDYSRVYLR